MRNTIASQLVCNDLPGFSAMPAQQTFEESPCGGPIPASLRKHVDYLTILTDGAPEVMLFAIDLREYFINVEGIALALVLPLQSPSVYCAKLNTP